MSLQEFKEYNRRIGGHWFDADTMQFWGSKIELWNSNNGYFISSEFTGFERKERAFTVRRANFDKGTVETVSEFNQFPTLIRAKNWIGENTIGVGA